MIIWKEIGVFISLKGICLYLYILFWVMKVVLCLELGCILIWRKVLWRLRFEKYWVWFWLIVLKIYLSWGSGKDIGLVILLRWWKLVIRWNLLEDFLIRR